MNPRIEVLHSQLRRRARLHRFRPLLWGTRRSTALGGELLSVHCDAGRREGVRSAMVARVGIIGPIWSWVAAAGNMRAGSAVRAVVRGLLWEESGTESEQGTVQEQMGMQRTTPRVKPPE